MSYHRLICIPRIKLVVSPHTNFSSRNIRPEAVEFVTCSQLRTKLRVSLLGREIMGAPNDSYWGSGLYSPPPQKSLTRSSAVAAFATLKRNRNPLAPNCRTNSQLAQRAVPHSKCHVHTPFSCKSV